MACPCFSKNLKNGPKEQRQGRDKKSQEKDRGVLQLLRANFRCQKPTFQNVLRLTTFQRQGLNKNCCHCNEYHLTYKKVNKIVSSFCLDFFKGFNTFKVFVYKDFVLHFEIFLLLSAPKKFKNLKVKDQLI